MTFDYEAWIKQAKDRLELLYQQREAINDEIANLESGIEGFAPLVKSLWIGPSAGITASVRQVLKSEPDRIFSPTEIRSELLNRGVVLKQDNPMATIHQVLIRLEKQGDAKTRVFDGRPRYYWGREKGHLERKSPDRLRGAEPLPSPRLKSRGAGMIPDPSSANRKEKERSS